MDHDRIRELVEDLERTLVDFIRTRGVDHDEYRAATDLVIASIQAGEQSLLFVSSDDYRMIDIPPDVHAAFVVHT